ncbi:hypothetical protein KIN20_010528 [Parelaphostrongylus tenuis]|uniref:Uncharacterized protein n=1 Tax=Parelaphostrongylus tenuis TaxID=148309 RepID=A0AAD5QIU0_PARTN|nr:hypothetical protein KIN20_010528 [Parelaphostrongylus tenuis]
MCVSLELERNLFRSGNFGKGFHRINDERQCQQNLEVDSLSQIDDDPGLEQLLSVLLSFVEQRAIPVLEVEKVTERALLPTPAIEVLAQRGRRQRKQRSCMLI